MINNLIDIKLKKFNIDFLSKIWEQGFREENPEWKKWDGPYFDDDYRMYTTFDEFLKSNEYKFFMNDNCRCILYNDEPVGMVNMHWSNRKTLWLNIGITIYDPNNWNKGLGVKALNLWIENIFNTYNELKHIGLVTWSGNIRMLKAAEKLGMKKEACIRKVRFWNNIYYDSISYGILREEFYNNTL